MASFRSKSMTRKASWNRHSRSVWVALVVAGCAGPPQEEKPPAEAGAALVGKAPPATGGYASVIMLAPEVPIETPIPTESALMDQHGTPLRPKLLLVPP